MANDKDIHEEDGRFGDAIPAPDTETDELAEGPVGAGAQRSGKFDRLTQAEGSVRKLTGMYKNWFLDYASYVILERAVPHVEDGLKPDRKSVV